MSAALDRVGARLPENATLVLANYRLEYGDRRMMAALALTAEERPLRRSFLCALVGLGMRPACIARVLGCSPSTVEKDVRGHLSEASGQRISQALAETKARNAAARRAS